MATLSDLREVKEALDAGLVSQADYDDVKRDYLRAQKEALVEFQKRELLAKEEFQKRKAEADLRAYALESIVKHGSSLMSEEQKADLVRDYIRMSGLDCGAENDERASKRQRVSAETRDVSPQQPSTPPALLLLFLLLLMPPLQRMRTNTATILMMTVRMILSLMRRDLQSEQVVRSGQTRTTPF